MRHTRFPASASAAPRLTVVVVLPTPPFWFINAIVRMGSTSVSTLIVVCCGLFVVCRRRLNTPPSPHDRQTTHNEPPTTYNKSPTKKETFRRGREGFLL